MHRTAATILVTVAALITSVLLHATPARAAPTVQTPGCSFQTGVTTCHSDEAIQRSIPTPRTFCVPGDPALWIESSGGTTTYLRTTTQWQGLYVNDHQRFLGSATSTWVDKHPTVSHPLDTQLVCPV